MGLVQNYGKMRERGQDWRYIVINYNAAEKNRSEKDDLAETKHLPNSGPGKHTFEQNA